MHIVTCQAHPAFTHPAFNILIFKFSSVSQTFRKLDDMSSYLTKINSTGNVYWDYEQITVSHCAIEVGIQTYLVLKLRSW